MITVSRLLKELLAINLPVRLQISPQSPVPPWVQASVLWPAPQLGRCLEMWVPALQLALVRV